MSEPDKLMPHDSDGIMEYDNPSPGWWLWSFFASIAFAIGYMFFYGMNYGGTEQDQYQADVIRQTAAVQAWFVQNPMVPPSSAILLAEAVDPASVEAGRQQFVKTCAACHGENAQGIIGPNLTDNAWIHGGKATEIWTTIVKGVPAKGMPTWGRTFKPETLTDLAAYVRSVQGSNPPNARPAEGQIAEMEPLPNTDTPSPPAQ